MKPLVVVAAVRRTGSTLLGELLTDPPVAFVFREPGLFRGALRLKAPDVELLRRHGVDLSGLAAAPPPSTADGRHAAERFLALVVEPMRAVFGQVGVKEISYRPGFLDVLEALGPVRVVASARDPRDQYLSLAGMRSRRVVRLSGPWSPETVARDIETEALHQRAVIERTGALRVRYEDLCTDPAVVDEVRRFTGSAVTGAGHVGRFKPVNRAIHGETVTTRRVARHRRTEDLRLAAEADEVAERLEWYREYWGYP